MEAIEGSWQDTAYNVMDRTLPPVCLRPESIFQIPAMLLSDMDCFKATLSMLIGMAIVTFAGVIKLPQITRIMSNKSVEGLSVATFLFETFGYTYNLAAHYRQEYPITTYGDFFVLIAENYFIIYLCYSYTGRAEIGVAVVAGFFASLVVLCSPLFPLEILKIMLLGNVAVVVLGRTPQIYANYVNKSSGALSIITCWGIFLGASARIFTTLQEVDSLNILIGYLTAAIFNGIIAFQVLYYSYIVKKPVSVDVKVKKAE